MKSLKMSSFPFLLNFPVVRLLKNLYILMVLSLVFLALEFPFLIMPIAYFSTKYQEIRQILFFQYRLRLPPEQYFGLLHGYRQVQAQSTDLKILTGKLPSRSPTSMASKLSQLIEFTLAFLVKSVEVVSTLTTLENMLKSNNITNSGDES